MRRPSRTTLTIAVIAISICASCCLFGEPSRGVTAAIVTGALIAIIGCTLADRVVLPLLDIAVTRLMERWN